MNICLLFQIFVTVLWVDIKICQSVNSDEKPTSLIEECLKEIKEPLDTDTTKLDVFKLGQLHNCIDSRYNQTLQNLKRNFAAFAPFYIRSYIDRAEIKLFTGIGWLDHDQVKTGNEIIRRAEEDGADLETIKDKDVALHYAMWRSILIKNNSNVALLQDFKKRSGIEDDDLFATEIAYLWACTSPFGSYIPPENEFITLDTLQEGLRMRKMALRSTLNAFEALFSFLTYRPPQKVNK